MSYVQLSALPGVCLSDSAYSNSIKGAYTTEGLATGRYVDMLGSRFFAGRPEKKGGWIPLILTKLTGVCRGEKDWRDFSQNLYCAFGTNLKLQVFLNSTNALIDITPLRSILTGTLTNPLTTSTSTTVSVAHTAHGLKSGDYAQLTANAVVDNVQVAGTYFVTVVDANNYTITVPSPATGSTSGGGGQVSYVYYRITLTNPFTTVSGSNIVTVAHTNNGASVGDYVTISNATAVNGITLDGEYPIQSTSANSYTVNAANAASGSGSGGGTPNFQYDISSGQIDAGTTAGYGTGTYSTGGYGLGQTTTTFTSQPRIWALDNYGQQLLASPYNDTIYVWDPSTYTTNNGRAYPLYGAPTNVLGMFVTPERFVFALGAAGNPLEVQWPDQNDYTNWNALPTNTANSRTIQIGSFIVGGIAARDGSSLVLTNNCCYAFNYSGDTFIYDSTAAGRNSGLIGPLALTTYAGNAYWMSEDEFWTWNGAVQPLPSDDIRDYVFRNINKGQAFKCFAVTDPHFKEITFYYPTTSGGNEITSSVTYHVDQGVWSIDTKSRTSQVNNQLFPYPISSDALGNIWQEEFGTDANGAALDSYVVFNPTAVMKGERHCDVMGFMPDFERQAGDCELSVLTQTYPDDPQAISGPYTLGASDTDPLIDLRIGSTFVGYKIESNVLGGDYRVGLPQVDVNPAGARR